MTRVGPHRHSKSRNVQSANKQQQFTLQQFQRARLILLDELNQLPIVYRHSKINERRGEGQPPIPSTKQTVSREL